MVPLSVLDLAPIVEGSDAAQALRNTLDLARHVEAWGYRRYWLAEHHNMDGVASSATAVLIGLLGSSLYSAQAAALLGLPFAFASHFAPALLLPALQEYRTRFQPSATLARPHAMVGVNVICADDDSEAARHATSLYLRFLGMQRGRRGPLPQPVASMDGLWSET